MSSQFPITDPFDNVGKIMRVVASVVGDWDAIDCLTDQFIERRLMQPLRDLLVIYGNGSGDVPRGVLNFKTTARAT